MSDETPTPAEPVAFRVVHVQDVHYDFDLGSATVVLREAEGEQRALTLPIALSDAAALHNAWRHIAGRRPSTTELVTVIMQELHADVIATRIVRQESGVYFAELDLMTNKGRRVFDARPSDAMVIALRQSYPAPILVAPELLASS